MRTMTQQECLSFIYGCLWASIITYGPDSGLYAIEATPFFMDAAVCFMINPRGGTWKNLRHSPSILLKFTKEADELAQWAGVSLFGTGTFVENGEKIGTGFHRLGERIGCDYRRAADTYEKVPHRSPLLVVQAQRLTGRCSAGKEAALSSKLYAEAPEWFSLGLDVASKAKFVPVQEPLPA